MSTPGMGLVQCALPEDEKKFLTKINPFLRVSSLEDLSSYTLLQELIVFKLCRSIVVPRWVSWK